MSEGMVVKTKTGQRGTTKYTDEEVEGKLIVYLEDEEGKPIMANKKEQKTLLCNPTDLTAIGFVE